MNLTLTPAEVEVVKDGLDAYWSEVSSSLSTFRDMLRDADTNRRPFSPGITRASVVATIAKLEERHTSIHNLLKRMEK